MIGNSPASIVDAIIDYESGELDQDDVVALFQLLIDTGQAWLLQGHYGRTAHDLIQGGYCLLGETGHNDAYGNYVPSRTEVKPGEPGTAEYVAAREEER